MSAGKDWIARSVGVVLISTLLSACGGGGGSTSAPTMPAATVTASSAPTIGVANAGSTQASVSFTAPASDGGSPIVSYTVTSSPGNIKVTALGSPALVTGLTNGTTYTFTVTAMNGVGTSPSSSASNAVTPAPTITAPNAPTIGVATAGNAQASVSFTAPTNNGGSAIVSYTVTSFPGNIKVTTTGSPVVVTGLTNGATYSFTVTATNAAGTSSPSFSSNSVIPAAVIASQGNVGTPFAIPAMPYNGMVGTTAHSFYTYTTSAAINSVSATAMTGDIDLGVFTDANFTALDPNWKCTVNTSNMPEKCIAVTPVAAGTVLYISARNFTGGAGSIFTLGVANVVVQASEGAANAPLAILAMPYNGMMGTAANSYYVYTTVATINQINTTHTYNQGGLQVFTDATFTTPSGNWNCFSGTGCTAITPVPAGTILYLRENNTTQTLGATYTLSVKNQPIVPSQGTIAAPVVITLPYAAVIGTVDDSFYKLTTAAAVGMITSSLLTADVDPVVYQNAAFTIPDPNWVCTTNIGLSNDTCIATAPVAAGTVLYIRVRNYTAGAGTSFMLQ